MASYLYNVCWATLFGLFVLCAIALAPPLFGWNDFFSYTFIGIPLVDFFIAALALAIFFMLTWQNFGPGKKEGGA